MIRDEAMGASASPGGGKASAIAAGVTGNPPSTSRGPARDAALDFIKGSLVLLMLLYHWLNFFISVHGFGYRYIRFITPSFVFLAGFLVTNLLVVRAGQKYSSLAARLSLRGVKLLVFFSLLNLGVACLPGGFSRQSGGLTGFVELMPATYLTGHGAVLSFFVLVPISYTLMLAALLFKVHDLLHVHLLVPAILMFAAGYGVVLWGVQSYMIELICSGLLGLMLGSALAGRLQHLRRWWPWLLPAYGLHLAALTLWGMPFTLQLISVGLNLWLLYSLAQWMQPERATMRLTALLGQYTLLGYVGQIAILRLLVAGLRPLGLGPAEPVIALVLAAGLLIAGIAGLKLMRRRSGKVDSLYRFVFA